MYFSLRYNWFPDSQLHFENSQPLKFQFAGEHDIVVTLRHPTPREKTADFLTEHKELVCTVTGMFPPTRKARPVFDCLAQGRIPNECLPTTDSRVEEDGRIKQDTIPPLEPLPPAFKDFIAGARSHLEGYATRTMRTMRWYCALRGVELPSGYDGIMHWSYDRAQWQVEPRPIGETELAIFVYRPLSEVTRDRVLHLVASGCNEPLAHELYLEAEQLRPGSPRSALLLGIAAAEVGLKECITDLVPGAGWLAMNSPSPPLPQMLEHYLPSLPARCTFDGKVLPPPHDLRTTLRDGIGLRNHLSHQGHAKVSEQTLDSVLMAVRNLLYLLDYYRGCSWALANIQPQVLTALGHGPAS